MKLLDRRSPPPAREPRTRYEARPEMRGWALTVLRPVLGTIWLEAVPDAFGWPDGVRPDVDALTALNQSQQESPPLGRRAGTGPSTVILDPRDDVQFDLAVTLAPFSQAVEAMSRDGVLVYGRGRPDDVLRLRLTEAEHVQLAGSIVFSPMPAPSEPGVFPVPSTIVGPDPSSDGPAMLTPAGPLPVSRLPSDVRGRQVLYWLVVACLIGPAMVADAVPVLLTPALDWSTAWAAAQAVGGFGAIAFGAFIGIGAALQIVGPAARKRLGAWRDVTSGSAEPS